MWPGLSHASSEFLDQSAIRGVTQHGAIHHSHGRPGGCDESTRLLTADAGVAPSCETAGPMAGANQSLATTSRVPISRNPAGENRKRWWETVVGARGTKPHQAPA